MHSIDLLPFPTIVPQAGPPRVPWPARNNPAALNIFTDIGRLAHDMLSEITHDIDHSANQIRSD